MLDEIAEVDVSISHNTKIGVGKLRCEGEVFVSKLLPRLYVAPGCRVNSSKNEKSARLETNFNPDYTVCAKFLKYFASM